MALIDARSILEKMYRGVLTVYEWTPVTDPDTHITSEVETIVVENQPCMLSNTSTAPVSSAEGVPSVTKTTKIFVAPDVPIKEGSKLVVTQDGVTNTYERSGIPSTYPTHQEVSVNIVDKVRKR